MPTLRRAVVMVQAEVADRMCAAPGSRTYGVPSVKLAWYGRARRAGSVSRTVFWPVPNVDSALVEFTRWQADADSGGLSRGGNRPGQPDRAAVFAVIDAAFAQRRKTLRAALASWAGSADAAERALRAADVDPAVRGEAIGVAQFVRIAEARGHPRRVSGRDEPAPSLDRPTLGDGPHNPLASGIIE
jgi:16S rRNA (adenine1518-N6/adenine1519-N6)-dimethyltransferase